MQHLFVLAALCCGFYLGMTSIHQKDTKPAKAQLGAVEVPQVPPLSLPHYADPGSALSRPSSYHSLGHCLRANVFPGAPLTWKSLARDSYISHAGTAWPHEPHLWYGHKTDDMVQWTEKNILNQKLDKKLKEMKKKSTTK